MAEEEKSTAKPWHKRWRLSLIFLSLLVVNGLCVFVIFPYIFALFPPPYYHYFYNTHLGAETTVDLPIKSSADYEMVLEISRLGIHGAIPSPFPEQEKLGAQVHLSLYQGDTLIAEGDSSKKGSSYAQDFIRTFVKTAHLEGGKDYILKIRSLEDSTAKSDYPPQVIIQYQDHYAEGQGLLLLGCFTFGLLFLMLITTALFEGIKSLTTSPKRVFIDIPPANPYKTPIPENVDASEDPSRHRLF